MNTLEKERLSNMLFFVTVTVLLAAMIVIPYIYSL